MLNQIEMAVECFKHSLLSPKDQRDNPLSPELKRYLDDRNRVISSVSGGGITSPEYWTYNQPNPAYAPDFITFLTEEEKAAQRMSNQ